MYNYQPLYNKIYRPLIGLLQEVKDANVIDDRSLFMKVRNFFSRYDCVFQTKKHYLIKKLSEHITPILLEHTKETPNPFIEQEHIKFVVKSKPYKMRKNWYAGAALALFQTKEKNKSVLTAAVHLYFPNDFLKELLNGKCSAKTFAHTLALQISHEIMHWDQNVKIAKRCIGKKKDPKTFLKIVSKDWGAALKDQKKYYSSSKEISAYAMNTAQNLLFNLYGNHEVPLFGAYEMLSNTAEIEKNTRYVFGLEEYFKFKKEDKGFEGAYKKYMKNLCKQLAIFGDGYGKCPWNSLEMVKLNNKINAKVKKVA